MSNESFIATILIAFGGIVAVLAGLMKRKGHQAQAAKIREAQAKRELSTVKAEHAAGKMSDAELEKNINGILARNRRSDGKHRPGSK